MSNAVFPTLPGLSYGVTKRPRFSTKIQTSVNGNELRAKFYNTPVYEMMLSFEFLRDTDLQNELKALEGFFLSHYGAWDSFLFQDPDDYLTTGSIFGTGDGVTTDFQLTRQFGAFSEPVYNVVFNNDLSTAMWTTGSAVMWPRVKSSPNMWVPVESGSYTISSTGLISFGIAPVAGRVLYWSGTYYYRCRFATDEQEYEKFMYQLWAVKQCELIGSLSNKI